MSLKKGVNTSDKRTVLAMIEQGAKPEEISQALQIELAVIEWFFPKPKAKPKASGCENRAKSCFSSVKNCETCENIC